MIDRDPSHGWLWLSIALLWAFSLVIAIVAASYDGEHERRIIELEKRCGIQGQR